MEELQIGTKGKWNGTVLRVLFLGQNGYAVMALKLDTGEEITAEGNIDYAQKGDKITVNGEIVLNKKYSQKQLKVTSSFVQTDTAGRAAEMFLTKNVKNVGPKIAKDLISRYGTDLDEFMTDKDKILAVRKTKKVNAIIKSYNENKHLYALYKVVNGEIEPAQAEKIFEKYKEKAAEILKNNPYQLTYDIAGIGFLTADKIALKTGLPADSDNRVLAGIIYCLRNNENTGSTYMSVPKICEELTQLLFDKKQFMHIYYQNICGTPAIPDDTSEWEELTLNDVIQNHYARITNTINRWDSEKVRKKFCKDFELTQEEIDTVDAYYQKKLALKEQMTRIIDENSFCTNGKTVIDVMTELQEIRFEGINLVIENFSGQKYVYLKSTYINEAEVAINLVKCAKKNTLFPGITETDIDAVIKQTEVKEQEQMNETSEIPVRFAFGEDQKLAVKRAIMERVSVITGGPGRGKTTIMKMAIEAILKYEPHANVRLLAPTGKAAKRMTESTGLPASTIHRFLNGIKMRAIEMTGKTIIFVDEMSMVDLTLFARLMREITECQIVFVGDKDQLPSVGVGKCLEDIINSETIPVTVLNTCYRNKGTIFHNTNVINAGEKLQEIKTDGHFKTYWHMDRQEAINKAVNTYLVNYKTFGAENMMVLCAMNATVTQINKEIQQKVNPKNPYLTEITTGDYTLRKGDRVMQTKNDYELEYILDDCEYQGIFNGETGIITDIKKKYDEDLDEYVAIIEVTFDDGKVAVYSNSKMWGKLTLAYAITYHKSQGSECKFLICTLFMSDFILLQRKILYTGISRGKQLVYMIGAAKAFQMAMYNFNGKNGVRYTKLKDKMIEVKMIEVNKLI